MKFKKGEDQNRNELLMELKKLRKDNYVLEKENKALREERDRLKELVDNTMTLKNLPDIAALQAQVIALQDELKKQTERSNFLKSLLKDRR